MRGAVCCGPHSEQLTDGASDGLAAGDHDVEVTGFQAGGGVYQRITYRSAPTSPLARGCVAFADARSTFVDSSLTLARARA
eukprot:3149356-Rhodomonas_salina.4